MNFDKIDNKTQFNIILRRKKELEDTLKGKGSVSNGTIDFTMHKINRERKKLNEELAKISFRYMPDTIA